MRRLILLPVVLLLISPPGSHRAAAQGTEPLTVEQIFSPEIGQAFALPSVQWLKDGRAVVYDRRKLPAERTLEVLDPSSGKMSPLVDAAGAVTAMGSVLKGGAGGLPQPVELSGDGKRGLYAFEGDLFVLEFDPIVFFRICQTPEEEKCASFSPDGKYLSFVRANNLYVYDLSGRREMQITADGSDSLLNGTLSWVYWEEVFGRRDTGYWWSDDSKSIAFFQTSEAGVSVQYYPDFKPWSPRVIRQRYPKIGERNPAVRVGMTAIGSGRIIWADLSGRPYEYVVRAKWLPDDRRLSVQTMNRLQTELDLSFVDAQTGAATHVLQERDSGWVNVGDDLCFLKDGKHFLWSSERTGYKHLYLFRYDGTLVRPVTQGNWSLRASSGVAWVDQSLVGIDEAGGWVFFTAMEKSPLERHLYRVRLDGSGFSRLSRDDGTHVISFSPASGYYLDRYSSIRTPPVLRMHASDGTLVHVLGEPRTDRLAKFHLQCASFFSIPARDGFPLPAQILKPADFDPGRRYPVILYVYGGPSAPQVTNSYERDLLWENLLAQNGFLVVRVDPRSATGISKKLENLVLYQLVGDGQLHDLVDAVRWIKAQPYADSARVGIWGWSGGGSTTMLCMTRSAEFAAGIAVAGVTDFRFYDTKFAEASMKTEQENREGLERASLLPSARDLHGRLLIVQGTYDDNVHPQNSWAFIDELIKANKRFDMMMYPMRGHGIGDPPARIHLYSTMLEFWKRNLVQH
jgi:dipeptidyl-peptidase-4